MVVVKNYLFFIMMGKLLGLNMCCFWLSIKEEEEDFSQSGVGIWEN
jgi:hypothetical protein